MYFKPNFSYIKRTKGLQAIKVKVKAEVTEEAMDMTKEDVIKDHKEIEKEIIKL